MQRGLDDSSLGEQCYTVTLVKRLKMAPTIRIDDEVYAWLQKQARPFHDTPNSVLRRLAQLGTPHEAKSASLVKRGRKTPQGDYRAPILKVLAKHGGQAARMAVLAELERMLAKQLTPFDWEHIHSGDIRWQKSAEWEVRAMREAGLLKPAKDGAHGHWVLSRDGKTAARGA